MSQVMNKANPVTNILNKQVANWSVLYMKLHNYHWYVKGESFFDLHIKFEELYTEAASHLDSIAERILALHGQPIATLKEALTTASLQEAVGGETANQMVKQLVSDFELISKEITDALRSTEGQNDQPTSDVLIAIRQSIEKHAWMFNAYLGK